MEALHRIHVCVPYRIELCHCTCSTGSVRRMVAACVVLDDVIKMLVLILSGV